MELSIRHSSQYRQPVYEFKRHLKAHLFRLTKYGESNISPGTDLVVNMSLHFYLSSLTSREFIELCNERISNYALKIRALSEHEDEGNRNQPISNR